MNDTARRQVMSRVRAAVEQGKLPPSPQFGAAGPVAEHTSNLSRESVEVRSDVDLAAGQPQTACDRFRRELAAIGGKSHLACSWAEATASIVALLANRKVNTLAIGPGEAAATLAGRLPEHPEWRQDRKLLRPDATAAAVAGAEVGIAPSELAIASTGTLIVRTEAGLLSSLLPPLFIALLPQSGIVPDITQALKRIFADSRAGARFALVTGPSRTADIEKKLVIGVHGPGELAAIILLDGMVGI